MFTTQKVHPGDPPAVAFQTVTSRSDAPGELERSSSNSGPVDEDTVSESDIKSVWSLRSVLIAIVKLVSLLVLLYLFICFLDLLASAFRLLGGRTAGQVFSDSNLLQNPVAGLMIGVLATVLLQSSSTSTSIIVSMVAADVVPVRVCIPMIMGANIGTSMTNTLVSVAHSADRGEFRRAFAGATVHDMFNWLCVFILLPLEIVTGYLYHLTSAIIKSMNLESSPGKKPPKLLKAITEPLTKKIIQIDKSNIKKIATNTYNQTSDQPFSLIKNHCDDKRHLFDCTSLNDTIVGIILLLVSLTGLIICLIAIVKILHSALSGTVAKLLKRVVNSDLPIPKIGGYLTGYLFIVLGVLFTILLQSSSVFTSALTPLVGVGVLNLERMYPLTLGSNVGTTFTAVLAALASSDHLDHSLQIAMCHLFFNISGILIFYPIPFMRKAPLGLATILGNTTARYRWFAFVYIVVMFFIFPGVIFGLSVAGRIPLFIFLGVCLIVVIPVVAVNLIQKHKPQMLPRILQTWDFLPEPLRSLDPLDRLLGNLHPPCMKNSCGFGRKDSTLPNNIKAAPSPDCTSNGDSLRTHCQIEHDTAV